MSGKHFFFHNFRTSIFLSLPPCCGQYLWLIPLNPWALFLQGHLWWPKHSVKQLILFYGKFWYCATNCAEMEIDSNLCEWTNIRKVSLFKIVLLADIRKTRCFRLYWMSMFTFELNILRYWFPYVQACNISSKRMWCQFVRTICRMADNVPWQVSSGLHEETTFR